MTHRQVMWDEKVKIYKQKGIKVVHYPIYRDLTQARGPPSSKELIKLASHGRKQVATAVGGGASRTFCMAKGCDFRRRGARVLEDRGTRKEESAKTA